MYILVVIIILLLVFLGIGNYFYNMSLNAKKDKSKVMEANQSANGFDYTINENTWFLENGKEVYLKGQGHPNLVGYEFKNKSSNNWVIVVHGYTQEAKLMSHYVRKFYEMGFNVFAPDLRGHGKSHGETITMGGLDSEDLSKWAEKIASENVGCKIILFGISMGAATVINSLDKNLPKNVVAFIEDCGFLNLDDMFSYQLKKIYKLPRFLVIPAASFVTKIRGGYSFSQVDASQGLRETKIPGLIIHGEKDEFVPLENANKIYNLLNSKKEIKIFKDAIHVEGPFKYPYEYWKIIDAFITSILVEN